jgi:fructokinase
MRTVGGVELGGTKTRVARGTRDGKVSESDTFPTEAPDRTFAKIVEFFAQGESIAALGVGAFGPVSINPSDDDFGRLRGTPKPGWRDFDIGAALGPLGVPFALDTDVNAAGIGEARLGALKGIDCGIYLTVGTGFGGALMVGGIPVHGAAHPEMGHIGLIRQPGDDAPSFCPFHNDCAEGLVAGPAIERRYGATLSQLDLGHPAHALVADYVGQLAMGLVLFASVKRIVIGGGVAKTPGFHARAQAAMLERLNGYAVGAAAHQDGFLVPPMLGDDAGLIGALVIAGNT